MPDLFRFAGWIFLAAAALLSVPAFAQSADVAGYPANPTSEDCYDLNRRYATATANALSQFSACVRRGDSDIRREKTCSPLEPYQFQSRVVAYASCQSAYRAYCQIAWNAKSEFGRCMNEARVRREVEGIREIRDAFAGAGRIEARMSAAVAKAAASTFSPSRLLYAFTAGAGGPAAKEGGSSALTRLKQTMLGYTYIERLNKIASQMESSDSDLRPEDLDLVQEVSRAVFAVAGQSVPSWRLAASMGHKNLDVLTESAKEIFRDLDETMSSLERMHSAYGGVARTSATGTSAVVPAGEGVGNSQWPR